MEGESENNTSNKISKPINWPYMNISSLTISFLSKLAAAGIIWGWGYFNYSIAWLIAPIAFSVWKAECKKDNELRMLTTQASALAKEKVMIMGRIDELPSWVYFPDFDRAEWLNRILFKVWPSMNHFVRQLCKQNIEPSIVEKLTEYKIKGFQFDRLVLGRIPPKIYGIKVYDKNTSRNEIILDADIMYAGDCDITFLVGNIKGGIKDFQIRGLIRIVMKPMLSVMPIIGGVQIFYLNNPTINYNLVGMADVLDLPGFNETLRKTIVEQIAAIVVLPNKITIPLSNEVPMEILKMPEPEGVLRIHVVEAKHLMKKDIGVLGKGKSDPYAVINVGAQEFRTKTIDNTVNPKWDFWCECAVPSAIAQQLTVLLWDYDDTKGDESLGRATIEIIRVKKKGTIDTWVSLEQAKHGMLHLRLMWLQLSKNPADLKAALVETQELRVTSMSTALLTLYIDSAKNLPCIRGNKQPDVYLEASIGGKKERTSTIPRSCDPVWEQGYTFLVSNPETEPELTSEEDEDHHDINQLNKRIERQESNISNVSSVPPSPLKKQPSKESINSQSHNSKSALLPEEPAAVEEELIVSTSVPSSMAARFHTAPGRLRHPSLTSSQGEAKLGRIQLTLHYSVQRQKLVVVVHKIANLPLPQNDPHNIPDPYVKLYLLPDRHKETKRKTAVMKDNCNPTFDEQFEYVVSQGDLNTRILEISVCTQKGWLSTGSNVMGQLHLKLSEIDISKAITTWYDLQPEIKD
ncbi:Extended synaptotagmin-2 [Camponotus floridanus]|uniref:Extended synaptotagmin-2 n=1 Tax=Camponotus floridanus TaxID=104421 RepID=E2A1E9_CAMFO|nr:Extended synaptotagmin-2 [Camponotus floridanus]